MVIDEVLRAHQLSLAILVDLVVRHPLALHSRPLMYLPFPYIEVVGIDEIVLVSTK